MKTFSSYLISQSLDVGTDKPSRSLVSPVSSLQTQSGVVLAISLIILLLLTLIGLSATQTTALEEKMAGNLRDKSLAFQAAEAALRFAEQQSLPPAIVAIGYYPLSSNPTEATILTDNFWNSTTAVSYSIGLGNSFYIIQKLPSYPPPGPWDPSTSMLQPYKFTVRATGGTTNTVVILQSIKTY